MVKLLEKSMLTIVPALTSADVDSVRALFREYEQSLGVDLCFQGFEEELASLPGKYAPPSGRLLIALDDAGDAAGCVALRPLGDGICEMKRLYLRPTLRGKGAGRALTLRVMDEARAAGYRTMRLDTLPMMKEAHKLYEALGFRRIAPYYPNPVPGAIYMERRLRGKAAGGAALSVLQARWRRGFASPHLRRRTDHRAAAGPPATFSAAG